MSDPSSFTYVFIDESGDPGFKLGSGSSPIFCLAAVVFRNTEDIDATEEAIQALKHTLGRKKTQEFHFNKENERVRLQFCQMACTCPFRIRGLVVDKQRIYPESLLYKSPKHFYNYFTKMLLKHAFGSITNAKVFIDGGINRELKTYLRQELNSGEDAKRIIHDTKFKDSKDSPIIQLADMVAGSLARAYKPNEPNAAQFLNILTPCVENIWDFGKKQES